MIKIGNLKIYGVIYKITNKKSKANNGMGKVYIGQTINGFNKRYKAKGNGIERIYNFHKNQKNLGKPYNRRLLNDIEKYGFENFEVCEIFDVAFSKEELNIKEILWIRHYNSINKGYNILEGGTIHKKSKILEKFKTYTSLNEKLLYVNFMLEDMAKFYNNDYSNLEQFRREFLENIKNGTIREIILRYKKNILKVFEIKKRIDKDFKVEYQDEVLKDIEQLLIFIRGSYDILNTNEEKYLIDFRKQIIENDLTNIIKMIHQEIKGELDYLTVTGGL